MTNPIATPCRVVVNYDYDEDIALVSPLDLIIVDVNNEIIVCDVGVSLAAEDYGKGYLARLHEIANIFNNHDALVEALKRIASNKLRPHFSPSALLDKYEDIARAVLAEIEKGN